MLPLQIVAIIISCLCFVAMNVYKFGKTKIHEMYLDEPVVKVLLICTPIIAGLLFICMTLFGDNIVQTLGMVLALISACIHYYILTAD